MQYNLDCTRIVQSGGCSTWQYNLDCTMYGQLVAVHGSTTDAPSIASRLVAIHGRNSDMAVLQTHLVYVRWWQSLVHVEVP